MLLIKITPGCSTLRFATGSCKIIFQGKVVFQISDYLLNSLQACKSCNSLQKLGLLTFSLRIFLNSLTFIPAEGNCLLSRSEAQWCVLRYLSFKNVLMHVIYILQGFTPVDFHFSPVISVQFDCQTDWIKTLLER